MKRILALVAVLGLLTACGSTTPNSASTSEAPAMVDVLYEVTGTADAVDVTLIGATGITQATNLAVPMARPDEPPGLTVRVPVGKFLSISAQNTGTSGTVTCSIKVDGRVISTNTSSGARSIAKCEGRA